MTAKAEEPEPSAWGFLWQCARCPTVTLIPMRVGSDLCCAACWKAAGRPFTPSVHALARLADLASRRA